MWAKILLLLFAFSFLFRTDHSFDQDLGRHIKIGELTIKDGVVPDTNLFSYTQGEFKYINSHWFFGVIAYLFQQSVGLQVLLVLKIAVILISLWLVLKIFRGEQQSLLLPLGFILFHVLRERTELRPEIFSFLFTASSYYILERFINVRTKLIYLLPLFQLIWVNSHIYFFVGLILQTIYLIYLTYLKFRLRTQNSKLKLLTIIFVLSVLISLFNPNGTRGFLYPLNVGNNYGYTIVENQNLFLLESINFSDRNFIFVKISAVLIIVSIIISFIRRGFNIKNTLIAVTGLTLALLHVRSFPYLVYLALPATVINFGNFPKKILKIFVFITALVLIAESFLYLNGSYYKYTDFAKRVNLSFEQNVKDAFDFVSTNDLPGPIYNNFDIGSYLIYKGYPEYKVFIDGRPEAYPKDFIQNIYILSQYEYPKFKELEKNLHFQTVIFSHTDQTPWGRNFLQNIIKDPDYGLVFIDDFMLILVKKEVLTSKGLNIVDLAKLVPQNYKYSEHQPYLRIGFFLLNNGFISGKLFIEKSLALFPDSPSANSFMANLTSQSNNLLERAATQMYVLKSKNYYFW